MIKPLNYGAMAVPGRWINKRFAFEPLMGKKPIFCGVEAPSFPLSRAATTG